MNKFLKFMLIMLLPIWLVAKNDDYEQVAAQIKESLQKVITEYRAGNVEQAVSDTQNAYFGLFEDVEAGIRINLGQKKAYSMEKQFGEIRKAIKAGEAPDDVQKRIDQINSEIAEVLPVILKGHRLVGEYSDSPAQAATTDYDTSKFIPEWKVAFANLSADLDKAIASYESDKQDDAKSAIQDAKFTDYRNTQLEIAIRQHIENGKSIDADIQRKMGEAISGITNGISKDDFKTKLDEIKKLAYEAISKLPADTAKLAKVDMSDVEAASEEDSGADYTKVVQNINDKIQAAITLYKNGDVKKAMGDIQDIYFDEFEGSGMENKVGAIDVNLKTAIEATFGNLVALMKSGVDEKTLQESASKMSSQLAAALEKTSGSSSPWTLFIWALTIILREGFEALIIVAAVVAYLVKTGNAKAMGKVVYSSVGVAVILSFVMAWIMNVIFGEAAGQKRELMEGITMLVAVGLLFYVGFWLLSNAGAKKWNDYIKSHVSESISSGSSTALWWTVFLAVFREGAETVLFYQALIFGAKDSAGYSMIAAGFVIGLIVLLIVYFLFKIFAVKIPIKPFFIFTSAIIFYMSIVFVGKGVGELVEGKIFIPTIIKGLSFPDWMRDWLGLQPYYESLVPQIIMVLALIIGIVIMKSKQNKN
ncbi:FTR1 family iron permease [Campylobacter concisus]|uniref:FTR1 family iron permease n=1 Tax=Campylobacter concisus TaxID=199 RepID=A0A1X0U3E0_9BACT|nr:FTR1 family protein [Campylobacter concisus]ORI08373.1 FTR1 family iron permease [Campylobacter concisus]OUT10050.1 FTR1 family iron permease [Campylobacter concisus]